MSENHDDIRGALRPLFLDHTVTDEALLGQVAKATIEESESTALQRTASSYLETLARPHTPTEFQLADWYHHHKEQANIALQRLNSSLFC